MCVCACVFKPVSCIQPFAVPYTVAGFLCPWDSPDKNTGVGCHLHLQEDPPDPGTEPLALASASGFFSTEPPAKSKTLLYMGY